MHRRAVVERGRAAPVSVAPGGGPVTTVVRVPPLVWLAVLFLALAAATAGFHALGNGHLAAPPLAPTDWSSWLAQRDPLVATVAILRLVVLALCWYLLVTTTAGVVVRLLHAARGVSASWLLRLADGLTVPFLRRLLQQALGVAIVSAIVVGGVLPTPAHALPPLELFSAPDEREGGAGARSEPESESESEPEPEPDGATTGSGGADGRDHGAGAAEVSATLGPPSTMTLRRLPPAVPTRSAAGVRSGSAGSASGSAVLPWSVGVGSAAAPAVSSGVDAAERNDTGLPEGRGAEAADHARTDAVPGDTVGIRHLVRPGESLWSIATEHLTTVLGHAPRDREVVPYWREVIEVNRHRLVDPDDADLILPGQELSLPTPASAP